MKQYLRSLKRYLTKAANQLPVSSKVIGTPRKCSTALAYAAMHPGTVLCRLAEESELNLPAAQINRPEHASRFVRARKTQAQYVLRLPQGRVWGANGAVVTGEDVFLSDLSREFGLKNPCTEHSVFFNVRLPKPAKVSGTVAVAATAGSNVYYHWLLDVLPRLLLLKEVGWLNTVDCFVLNYEGLPFQRQTLGLLKIEEERIVNCYNNRGFHIEAETLLVPSLPSRLNEVNGFECDLLQKHLFVPNAGFGSPKRVYITRKQTGTRTVLNEDEVVNYLNASGFEVLVLESFTLQEQWQIFHSAEMIAGPHGSAFANVAFCKPGTVLLDILPDSNVVTCFYNLAAQRGVRYYGYIDKGMPMNGNRKNDNVLINMKAFDAYVKAYLLS